MRGGVVAAVGAAPVADPDHGGRRHRRLPDGRRPGGGGRGVVGVGVASGDQVGVTSDQIGVTTSDQVVGYHVVVVPAARAVV